MKKVDFSFNGTATLENLQIVSVQDKTYTDETAKPLWAVERTGLKLSNAYPFWGVVSDEYEHAEGLWTYRAEKLWLPAVDSWKYGEESLDSCAGANAPGEALASILRYGTGWSEFLLPVYSGLGAFQMFRVWQKLSQESSTASHIINLIFTDILASATVGTKSLSSDSSAQASAESALYPVIRYSKTVQLNYLYAIPAFMFLACWLLAIIIALFNWIRLGFSIARMRQLLNQTSMGRVATTILHPTLCEPVAPTSEWVKKAGRTELDISDLGNQGTRSIYDGRVDHSDVALVPQDGSSSSRASEISGEVPTPCEE